MEPGWRAKYGSNVVHPGRAVLDGITVIQDKSLAISCPLAGSSCLNRHKYRL